MRNHFGINPGICESGMRDDWPSEPITILEVWAETLSLSRFLSATPNNWPGRRTMY